MASKRRDRSLIKDLYEAVTGRQVTQTPDTRQGTFDPKSGSYYCGVNANMPNIYITEDVKSYIQSRYFDYMHEKVDRHNRPLSQEQIEINRYKADALLDLMDKFNIPVADFSSGKTWD